MSETHLEGQFNRAMLSVYERARDEAHYTATRFAQMLSELGGLATAHRLLASTSVSEGFTALWEAGRLDLSVEALVSQPEFEELFSHRERVVARERLASYGYQ